jgi:hypothetical protein
LLAFTDDDIGPSRAPANIPAESFAITTSVVDDRLHVSWHFVRSRHRVETVGDLLAGFVDCARQLAAAARKRSP